MTAIDHKEQTIESLQSVTAHLYRGMRDFEEMGDTESERWCRDARHRVWALINEIEGEMAAETNGADTQ